MDEETRKVLERGRRVRALLKQTQFSPQSSAEQVHVLYAVTQGIFDEVAEGDIAAAEEAIIEAVGRREDLREKVEGGTPLEEGDLEAMKSVAAEAVRSFVGAGGTPP